MLDRNDVETEPTPAPAPLSDPAVPMKFMFCKQKGPMIKQSSCLSQLLSDKETLKSTGLE